MRALPLALAASLPSLLVQPLGAQALDPAQAGREAHEDLRSLLDEQHEDRKAEAARPKPEPPKARPDRPSKASEPLGGNLPAVCAGCGTK